MPLNFFAEFYEESPTQQLLANPQTTLEQILDVEDLVQECQSNSPTMVQFLCDRLPQLLGYIFSPVDTTERTVALTYHALQVMTCNNTQLYSALMKNTELVQLVLSPLAKKPPIPPQFTFPMIDVVRGLILREPAALGTYLKDNPNVLRSILAHIGTPGLYLLTSSLLLLGDSREEADLEHTPQFAHWWLTSGKLFTMLLKCCCDVETLRGVNTVLLLCEIVQREQLRFACNTLFETPDFVPTLFRKLVTTVQASSSGLDYWRMGVDFIITCLNHAHSKSKVLPHVLADILPTVVVLLTSTAHLRPVTSTTFQLDIPLGQQRLETARMLSALALAGGDTVFDALVQHNVFPELLKLFFTFGRNNLLHSYVTDVIVSAFSAKNKAAVADLMGRCKLLTHLMNGYQKGDTEYHGHVLYISGIVIEHTNGSTNNQQWDKMTPLIQQELTEQELPLGGAKPSRMRGDFEAIKKFDDSEQPVEAKLPLGGGGGGSATTDLFGDTHHTTQQPLQHSTATLSQAAGEDLFGDGNNDPFPPQPLVSQSSAQPQVQQSHQQVTDLFGDSPFATSTDTQQNPQPKEIDLFDDNSSNTCNAHSKSPQNAQNNAAASGGDPTADTDLFGCSPFSSTTTTATASSITPTTKAAPTTQPALGGGNDLFGSSPFAISGHHTSTPHSPEFAASTGSGDDLFGSSPFATNTATTQKQSNSTGNSPVAPSTPPSSEPQKQCGTAKKAAVAKSANLDKLLGNLAGAWGGK